MAVPDAHKNLAVGNVATAPSPANSGTSLVLGAGQGARFPAVPFNATVFPSGSIPDPTNAEIIRVTAISTDTLTISRTQEGTSARSIGIGDYVVAGPTAKTFTDIEVKTKGMTYDVVSDGGADPSGVTDATTIINTAISTVAAAGGGIVFFPTGTYKVNTAGSAIAASGNYVTLRGAGSVAAQLVSNHATSDVIALSGNNCRVEDLRIIATSSSTKTGGHGINITGSNCSVFNVDLIYQFSGLRLNGQLARADYCNIRETGRNAANGQCILLDSFTDQYISNITMDNGAGIAPGNVAPYTVTGMGGIRITNLSSLIMVNMQVIHCGTCLDVIPSGGNTIPSIKAVNCFFDSSTIGANFAGAGTISRSTFVNCWFSTHANTGIILNNSTISGVEFVACEVYDNAAHGIDAQNYGDWTIRASKIAKNVTTGIRTTAVAAGTFSISDNTIGTSGGFAANGTGINVQSGTYKSYQILDNRRLETNTTSLIDNGVVAAADQKNVTGNLGLPMGTVNAANVQALTTVDTVIAKVPIPANALRVGTTFRITGYLNRAAATASILNLRARFGTTGTNADAQVILMAPSSPATANTAHRFEMLITCRAIGNGTTNLTGTGHTAGQVNNATSAAAYTASFMVGLGQSLTTGNSTVANFLTLTLANATSSTTDVYNCSIEVVAQ